MERRAHTAAIALALGLSLTMGAWAATNLQIFTFDLNDTSTLVDNITIQTNIHWADSDMPVRFLAFRPVGSPIYPAAANINDLTEYQIQMALNRALEAWNDTELDSGFEFESFALTSDFYGLANQINPLGWAQLDGFNFITFQDADLVGDALGTTPAFVVLRDFDLFDLPGFDPTSIIPVEFIGSNVGDLGVNALPYDLDGDGYVDVLFFRSEFRRGEIIDCDIGLTLLTPFDLLPEDPDDIPEELFEDIVFGMNDLEFVTFHELGHALGLGHSYLFGSVMYPFLHDESNSYDKREPQFDDEVGMALTYGTMGPGDLGDLGAIAGSLISGDQADGIDANGNPQPPDPLLLYLFQNPVFVGVPDPGFDLNTPQIAGDGVPQVINSNQGPIRLITFVLAGHDVVFPYGDAAIGPAQINSEYYIPGLPPRDDYVLWTTPQVRPYSAVSEQYVFEDYPDEFFGGATPLPFGTGFGRDLNDPEDNTVENLEIQIGSGANGQFTIGFESGPDLLFGHPTPATSFSTVRVIDSGVTEDHTNRFDFFGTQQQALILNDGANLITGVWETPEGIQVRETLRIINAGGLQDAADDVLISFELRNTSDRDLGVGLRIMLDTIAGDNDGAPFIVGNQRITETTLYQGINVPVTYSLVNPSYPRLTLEGRLSGGGATTPDRFLIGHFSDLFGSTWDVVGGGSFTSPEDLASDGACAVFFDPVTMPPGSILTHSTIVGGVLEEGLVPETGVAAAGGPYEDDTLEAEPITVLAGAITDGINIFTNTGLEPPTAGVTTPTTPSVEIPIFGPPIETPETQFPVDQDASIDLSVADFDNDGDLDIVYANAIVSPTDPSAQINRIYLNGGYIPATTPGGNELGIGNFVDATFGRNGVADGPPPYGDDRLPIVYDTNPSQPGYQTGLINEVTYSVNLADFNGDGWVDLHVSNYASITEIEGAQNRLFINHEGTFGGETFRHFVDETLGVGGPTRLPGILNQGPFPTPDSLYHADASSRSDVGDIDSDGDLDIVIPTVIPITPRDPETGAAQQAEVPQSSDPEATFNRTWPPSYSTRVLINDGNGFFTEETLGEDNLFGGRPRGEGIIEDADIGASGDRDRIPPNLWDYIPDNNNPEDDLGLVREVVLCQFAGGPELDFWQISQYVDIVPYIKGINQLFQNEGGGYFSNISWGTVDYIIDPDTSDIYPSWLEYNGDDPPLQIPRNTEERADVRRIFGITPPALIGIPDGGPYDASDPVSGYNDIDQVPQVQDDSFGGTVADTDGDGDPDLLVLSMADPARITHATWGTNLNAGDPLRGTRGGLDEPLLRSDIIYNEVPPPLRTQDAFTVAGPNRRFREGAWGDLDLDGDPDAYLANDGTGANNSVTPSDFDVILLNDGSGNLSEDISGTSVILEEPTPTFDVELRDMDNDGDLDAVLANSTAGNRVLFNYLISAPPTPLVSGDAPLFNDASEQYLLQNFGGTPIPAVPDEFVGVTSDAAFVDLDNDGDLDLYISEGLQSVASTNKILINSGTPINEGVAVFKNTAAEFPFPQIVQGQVPPGDYISLMDGLTGEALCDADNDGYLDTAQPGSTPTISVEPADYDGDGDYDIFIVNNGFRNSMLWNMDDDELEFGDELPSIENVTGPIGAVRTTGFTTNNPDENLLGDGLLVDVTHITLPGNDVRHSNLRPDSVPPPSAELLLSRESAAGDFDGDGDIDIFVTNGVENGTVKNPLLINQGGAQGGREGVFHMVNEPDNDGRFTPEATNVRNSFDAATFDIDNDGDLDIYVADRSVTAQVEHTLWINSGSARFTATPLIIENLDGTLDQNTVRVLVADWDADGEPTEDLNGNGFLDPEEDLDGDWVIDYLDLNGNGRHDADYDVLLVNTDARDLMLVNDGTGILTDESDLRVPNEDRNGNGALDNGEDSDGDGEIGPIIRDSQDADFADVDLDGDLDIAIAQSNPDPNQLTNQAVTLQLWINDGTGVFTDVSFHEIGTTQFVAIGAESTTPFGNGNSRVVRFGDVDGDGDHDMFVGNLGFLAQGILAAAPDTLLVNRTIGLNLNARAMRHIAPGFAGPVVNVVSPPSAEARPQTLTVTVRGYNFQEGANVSFGQGIETLSVHWVLPNELRVQLRIQSNAAPGPRTVVVTNPTGLSGNTAMGAFSLSQFDGSVQQTSVNRSTWSMYR
ncbi:VCBS repeat-containing protein [Candidatus Sumerlaeota bacterium]|nr:VCBS repeat-containing protein [Candidatus Sumerlaeota bacterium]